MRYFLPVCTVLLFFALAGWGQEAILKQARERRLKGNYAEAREQYEKLVAEGKGKPLSVIGLSRVMESQGEYEQALQLVEKEIQQGKPSPALLARQAELLHYFGRREEALKACEDAIKGDEKQFLARWVRASIYQERGDVEPADKEYRWFVRTYSDLSDKDMDIKDPEALMLVGLAGCENVRINIKKDNSLSEQFTFILNEVYKDAIKYDPNYWPVEYQAGLLLLEKYNRGEALEAFGKVLKINPNSAEANVGYGWTALQKLDLKEAEERAEKALKINPNLMDAILLRGDVYLAEGNLEEAIKTLDKARKINPRNEATLGRLAACRFLSRQANEFDKLTAEAEKSNPKPGLYYFILAERLEERRYFADAEKFYQKASVLQPHLVGPQSALGLLFMRMGREQDARKILDLAFDADPFNVRVSNNLKVLRHLDKYKTIKTPHYEIRYDPKNDDVLANFMAEYLEEVYKDLADKFQFKPKEPILFELFNNHEMFSGRVVSLPDLHTIGACTGKMVAMVSPRGKGIPQKFNWGRVVRHEIVHIFNLEQTNYLIPHWFTEGLAVENEGFPRPPLWNQLLLERVPKDVLKNLDTIDMAFMKPTSQADWTMAYCQSQLYVQYIKLKFGEDAIGKLLAAFAEGVNSETAIQRVCKVNKETFESGYKNHLKDLVKSIKGKPVEKVLDFQQLKAANEKDPDDAEIAGKLALAFFRRNDKAQARKLADEVLNKKKNQPQAAFVKAKLLEAAGDTKESQALLEAAVDENNPDPLVVGELAKLYFNGKDGARAAKMFELGRKAEPYEKKWLEGLAKSYADSGDKAKQIAILKEMVPLDADDLDNRRRLAQLLLDAGKQDEAEKFAREALEIDVLDKDAQETLLSSLKAQNKDKERERMSKLLGR